MLHNSDTTAPLWGLSGPQMRAVTGAIEGLMALMTTRQAPAAARVQAAQAILDAAVCCRLEGISARLQAVEAALRAEQRKELTGNDSP